MPQPYSIYGKKNWGIKMEASIDGYTQMTVRFSEEDLSQLESSHYIVRLIPEAIRLMKEGKFVGFDFLSGGTQFRKVLISRDDIF